MNKNAKHQRDHRERMKDKGLVQVNLWSKPEHVQAIRAFAKKLNETK
jgi:hypothetical protein